MQMSRNYQSTSKKLRAQQLRTDGRQLQRAGFKDSAEQNFELAEILDPTPREEIGHDSRVDRNAAVRSGTHTARSNKGREGHQVSRRVRTDARVAA